MTKDEFREKIEEVVSEYIAEEQSYDDNAQLEIDPESYEVEVTEGTEGEEAFSIPGKDYYDVMDLVCMSVDQPGKWLPDEEAIDSIVDEYFQED